MRPKHYEITMMGPHYIPVNWRGGALGVTATVTINENYDVAYTMAPIGDGADQLEDGQWTDITNMSAATASASKEVGPCTCLRVTLNSGTKLLLDVVQNDI